MPEFCAAPRCAGKDVPAEPSAYLCRGCRLGLHADLRHLPRRHAALEAMLAAHTSTAYVPGGTSPTSVLPYNDAVSECRSQIVHDAVTWVRLLLEEFAPSTCPVNTLPAMCAWLRGWANRVALQRWADEMAGAFAADAGRAWFLLHPPQQQVIPVPGPEGTCPDCREGRLNIVNNVGRDPLREDGLWIVCPSCSKRLPPWQWMRFGMEALRRREMAGAG